MPAANRSVYVIGAAGFCTLIRQISTTKTNWCSIGPALRLKPPVKNQPAGPAPAGHSLWCHGFYQRENEQTTSQSCIAPPVQTHPNLTASRYGAQRATVTLRQRHIPSNVVCNFIIIW